MCLEIGNKVAVIDDVIKGFVVSVSKERILIRDDEGMEFWFDSIDLVKIDIEQNEIYRQYNEEEKNLRKELERDEKRKKKGFVKVKKEIILEVDLHVEKLVKSTKQMDNYDILSLQIETAKRKIEYCIYKKISKVIFIHGVGEGVLKEELQYLLNRYSVKYYDASYKKYGAGATEVYIYQNN